MQNAFASPGGLLDLAGVDISGADQVVGRIGKLLAAARTAGVQVVYLQTGYKPDLSNGGGAASPNPRKETALCFMRARPELKGKLLVEGTWDFQIVEALAPGAADIVVQAGPPEAHAATVFNVESFFGWTIGTGALIEALGRSRAGGWVGGRPENPSTC